MTPKELPDLDVLYKYFIYNPETGKIYWSINKGKNIKAGKEICNFTKRGYNRVYLNYKGYQAHRVVWKMFYKENPLFIDHIDGNGLNNKIENLRNVSLGENSKNCKATSLNISGRIGVSYKKRRRKYEAFINVDKKYKHLGTFNNFEDAVKARMAAEKLYGYHKNHGR